MAMNLDPTRLTSADPKADAERQFRELRDAEGYLTSHGARVMVDFTGRGRMVVFEAGEMLLAVRAAKDRVHKLLRGETEHIDAEPIPDPRVGFAQPTSEPESK